MHRDYSVCLADRVLSPVPGEDTADFDTATEANGGAAGVAHLGFSDAFVSVSQSHLAGEVWAEQTDLQGRKWLNPMAQKAAPRSKSSPMRIQTLLDSAGQ